MTNKEWLKMLGLSDRTITSTLEEDILNNMGGFVKDRQEHENKKREFISLFKECYNDIVKIIEFDPHRRIPVNCYTCIRGMDLSKQYGKPKEKVG